MDYVCRKPTHQPNPEPPTADIHGARILVVEDEFIIAMEVALTLVTNGAEVIGPAHTLAEAMNYAMEPQISAVILDLRLGRDTVVPVARQLAARGIPFLFHSGQPASDPARREWPHTLVISKPASSQELLAGVMTLLQSPSQDSQNSKA